MIYIYAVKIRDTIEDSIMETFWSLVSSERKERISRFRNLRDKQRGILAEVLLRYALYKHYNLNEGIIFVYNQYGKPFLKGNEDIFFNMSHSGDWIFCGVGSVSLGVDVEQIAKADMRIARRFFSETEYSYLIGLDADQQNSEFYKIWTLKESYIKEEGMGLSIPLNSFSFTLAQNKILLYEQNCIRKDLQFWTGMIDKKHCYAVCINGGKKQIPIDTIQRVTTQELQAFGEIVTTYQ